MSNAATIDLNERGVDDPAEVVANTNAQRAHERNLDAEYVRNVPHPGAVAAAVLGNVTQEVPRDDTGFVACRMVQLWIQLDPIL